MKRRSHIVVYAGHGVEQWKKHPPSVESARPSRCPRCGCASRVVGEPLKVIGHGLRTRLQYGPQTPNGAPLVWSFELRRYKCKPCSAIIEVVPPSVEPRRLYSRQAIAWALKLFGVDRVSAGGTAVLLQPWRRVGFTARSTWVQLRRWCRAIGHGALFDFVQSAPQSWTHRQVAERAAMTVAAYAPIEMRQSDLSAQVWAGALHAP